MRAWAACLTAVLLSAAAPWSHGAEAILVVEDADGAAGRVAAPACARVDLSPFPAAVRSPGGVEVVELLDGGAAEGERVAAQFEPEAAGSARGTLWWLMPPGRKGLRRFRLRESGGGAAAALSARVDSVRGAVELHEGPLPVLRYNHHTVPVPPGIDPQYARGDYIHPLCGPDGESITDDYSQDHPHHRGVSWAWPITRWKGESRDLWAVKVLPGVAGGVWSRPVGLRRAEAGPVWGAIEAENVWKWGDRDPIVREQVLIRAFRSTARRRFVDVEIRLTGLVDDVRIGGRPKASYGGFCLRSFPSFPARRIGMHIDPPGSSPRRAWFYLSGQFPGGCGPAGVVLLECVANPDYPNQPRSQEPGARPGEYPPWRSLQPAYPGDREVPLPRDKTLVLRYRLWIHPGTPGEGEIVDAWSAYALSTKEMTR